MIIINNNIFREFHKAAYAGDNMILATYNTALKCLGDLIGEYYIKKQRLNYLIIMDEVHTILHIGLIEITKKSNKLALIIVTTNDNNYMACFKYYKIIIHILMINEI